LIDRARQATLRKFPAKEKIRIVMEGIHPTIYCKWLKDFMEAGKGRLPGDAKQETASA
jgi:hypothetical protein